MPCGCGILTVDDVPTSGGYETHVRFEKKGNGLNRQKSKAAARIARRNTHHQAVRLGGFVHSEACSNSGFGTASVIAFLVYAGTGHAQNPAIIFTSLTLFQLIRMPLMMTPMGTFHDFFSLTVSWLSCSHNFTSLPALRTVTDGAQALSRLIEVFVWKNEAPLSKSTQKPISLSKSKMWISSGKDLRQLIYLKKS